MLEYDDPIISEIKNAAPFPVNVECESYPDVIFNIIFEKHPNVDMADECVSALDYYAYSYNKWHFLKPIQYISDTDSLPEPSSPFSVCIHVDFGGASPKALVGAVKAIANADLPIYRLVLE